MADITERRLGDLRWVTVRGTPEAAFAALGEYARSDIQDVVRDWAGLRVLRGQASTSRGAALLTAVRAASRRRYPGVWSELVALAEGAAVPADELALQNFRGDLGVDEPDDGCSDLAWRREQAFLAHNEDDGPFFADRSVLLTLALDQMPVVTAYWKAGFLPSTTFTLTEDGLAWGIDHLTVPDPADGGAGRAIVARELQRTARTVDQVRTFLRDHPTAGGYGYLVGSTSGRVIVIDTVAGRYGEHEVTPDDPLFWHTNHGRLLSGAEPGAGGTTATRGQVLAALEPPAIEPGADWFATILTGAAPPDGVRADPGGPTPSITLITFVVDLTTGTVTVIPRDAAPVTVRFADLVAPSG